jgi:hypothetical protein
MPERNTPQKTLESGKQIAAYLERSERTVRRWEASEGLPVHRREQDGHPMGSNLSFVVLQKVTARVTPLGSL